MAKRLQGAALIIFAIILIYDQAHIPDIMSDSSFRTGVCVSKKIEPQSQEQRFRAHFGDIGTSYAGNKTDHDGPALIHDELCAFLFDIKALPLAKVTLCLKNN